MSFALFGVKEEIKKTTKRNVHVGIDAPEDEETKDNTLSIRLKNTRTMEPIKQHEPKYVRKSRYL